MDSTTQVLTTLVLLIAVAVTVIGTRFARRRDFYPVRALPAYEFAPLLTGQAIEAGRHLQTSSGAAVVGGTSTALALASADMLYHMTRRTVIAGETPIAVVGETSALPLMLGALRSGAIAAGRVERFRPTSARWVPSVSLTLAAGLIADIGDEKIGGGVYIGDFGPWIALPLEAIARRRGLSIAGSTTLEGQAVAYALSDAPLIGEELFVANAYLGDSAIGRLSVVTIDVLRLLTAAVILGGAVLALRVPLTEGLARLFGGG